MKKFALGIVILIMGVMLLYAQPPKLENLGNTCFMNALIQAINACVPARNYLVQQGASEYQDNFFLSSFVSLLADMQQKHTITTSLELFVDSACPLFERGVQDDAARLFGHLMNQFKDTPYEKFRLSKHEQTLAQFFMFKEKQITECSGIVLLEQEQISYYLRIPVIGSTLQDGFKGYLSSEEKLEDFSGISDCTQKSKLMDLPEIFVIGLNRFGYDPVKRQLVSNKKSITIPLALQQSLKPLMDNQNSKIDEYELIAIVMHHGTTVSSGHYTSYVREVDGNDLWYLCDDSSIIEVGDQLKIVDDYDYQKEGYLFFYMRANVVAHIRKHAREQLAAKEKALKELRAFDNLAQALSSLARG